MRWFVPFIFILMTGCAANIAYDYDPSTVFPQPQTFSFVDQHDKSVRTIDQSRIRAAVEREFANKAVRPATDAPADILVDFRIREDRRLQPIGFSYGLGLGWGVGTRSTIGMSTIQEAREIREGRLIVDLIDPQRNEVIWRAVSRVPLTENMAPGARSELINELVQEMLANYPPR
jgi:hypothetical protein